MSKSELGPKTIFYSSFTSFHQKQTKNKRSQGNDEKRTFEIDASDTNSVCKTFKFIQHSVLHVELNPNCEIHALLHD